MTYSGCAPGLVPEWGGERVTCLAHRSVPTAALRQLKRGWRGVVPGSLVATGHRVRHVRRGHALAVRCEAAGGSARGAVSADRNLEALMRSKFRITSRSRSARGAGVAGVSVLALCTLAGAQPAQNDRCEGAAPVQFGDTQYSTVGATRVNRPCRARQSGLTSGTA